ncbi:hypothetical protein EDI_158610 [Entamoeba dispar SAW760]|uniref:Uncharacterized protein n=1 Tax=Entamoeba dispar (strain ATCC PRA-260 / SAW760) TaxID=370354 RepID=B0E9S6_ENTDS|nr:uncharacterized protein EDI_158610 [Entamoeba dispar SAW760]EDR28723.1 hypothetical protein EDI_158610 [Entamoeba dispar SAW760]|eukprot:EDR28723.1 hypothetical protein EDI_158610 [Entamoeba dispar SAW760]
MTALTLSLYSAKVITSTSSSLLFSFFSILFFEGCCSSEIQLEVGCSHLLNPSIELENFPQLIDLNEDNFFRTKEEIENCQREEENEDSIEKQEKENKNESNEDIKKSIDEFLLNENEIIDGEDVSSDEVKLPRFNNEKEISQIKKQAKN